MYVFRCFSLCTAECTRVQELARRRVGGTARAAAFVKCYRARSRDERREFRARAFLMVYTKTTRENFSGSVRNRGNWVCPRDKPRPGAITLNRCGRNSRVPPGVFVSFLIRVRCRAAITLLRPLSYINAQR